MFNTSPKTPMEEQADKALTAIKKYKLEKFDRHIQTESLEQHLFDLFGKSWYPDRVYQYEQNIVTLLAFLLRPEVTILLRKQLSSVDQEDITQMLLQLYEFFRVINSEYNLLLLEMVAIENCQDMQKLKTIENKYKAKLEGCLAEQYALKTKTFSMHSLKHVDND